MVSFVMFTLSAAFAIAALSGPRKASRPKPVIYTYYVGDDAPSPTWMRKAGTRSEVAGRRD